MTIGRSMACSALQRLISARMKLTSSMFSVFAEKVAFFR
jgi:hypothetical protein